MLTNKLTGAGAADKTYIEDVFSTYLYTGNGSTQTINNGIDLAGKGGVVWIKSRSAATSNQVFDTTRDGRLITDSTSAQGAGYVPTYFNFNPDGFYLDAGGGSGYNNSGNTYASWTFRKAPKFFDVVTYTGTGAVQNVNHSLGSVPGMIIVKNVSSGGWNWGVYHRGANGGTNPQNYVLNLNNSNSQESIASAWNQTAPTATQFTLGTNPNYNNSGDTYVAYLFAHDTTTDGLIQCGSYTPDGSGVATVNLGWEPQFVLAKMASGTSGWLMQDVMRGESQTTNQTLFANLTNAESSAGTYGLVPNATGFKDTGMFSSGSTVIYMAVRRGPMRTPTDGTKVFQPNAVTPTSGQIQSIPFASDSNWFSFRSLGGGFLILDRLRLFPNTTNAGDNLYLNSSNTNAEVTSSQPQVYNVWNNSFAYGGRGSGYSDIFYNFQRAPGFFDVVCYTGNGSTSQNIAHNLGIAPELLIVKSRSQARLWAVYNNTLGATQGMRLNGTDASFTTGYWNDTTPTSTVFTVGNTANTNGASENYVAYLFASCPGVSKVGSYVGNGSSQTINCGFTNGARFVLIKRTDSTGDWMVLDTARGITTTGSDPWLRLNTTDAEVLGDDLMDPNSSGFILDGTSPINTNGASYIYLAIA